MKKSKGPYYFIYERYTDYNQFEGSWDIAYIEFKTEPEAKEWLRESGKARECRMYDRKLIGPLIHIPWN